MEPDRGLRALVYQKWERKGQDRWVGSGQYLFVRRLGGAHSSDRQAGPVLLGRA